MTFKKNQITKKILLLHFSHTNTMSSDRASWNIKASRTANQAHNPIRAIVDKLKLNPNVTKPLISLSIGKMAHTETKACIF